eukprot:scaffold4708_cov75-Phaeocystis_antarctica.AAC.3
MSMCGVFSRRQTVYMHAAITFWVRRPWMKLCCTASMKSRWAASWWCSASRSAAANWEMWRCPLL